MPQTYRVRYSMKPSGQHHRNTDVVTADIESDLEGIPDQIPAERVHHVRRRSHGRSERPLDPVAEVLPTGLRPSTRLENRLTGRVTPGRSGNSSRPQTPRRLAGARLALHFSRPMVVAAPTPDTGPAPHDSPANAEGTGMKYTALFLIILGIAIACSTGVLYAIGSADRSGEPVRARGGAPGRLRGRAGDHGGGAVGRGWARYSVWAPLLVATQSERRQEPERRPRRVSGPTQSRTERERFATGSAGDRSQRHLS